jgi:hypothetical protein
MIQYKMKHELLVSKVINELNRDIFVNMKVEKDLGDIKLLGYIDVLNINFVSKTVIEVKSGKEKEAHHVQLWLYMGCFDDTKGILQYPSTQYMYFIKDIPFDLWKIVLKRLNPLLSTKYCGWHCMCGSSAWFFLFDDLDGLSDVVRHLPTENTISNAEHRITSIQFSAFVLLFSSLSAWGSILWTRMKKSFK